ncbi:ATPase [Kribbella sp. ALI-6-A]|uniref:N-acetylglucosamine kinase n=1 Tax=Kribbella sp. ALI-6-A TaxID=1933817 RepID=UPI00097BBA6E|nr:BadF/BadG/BcrA/BcrD ATPase family protein [Kribbella sp. ALI-6-A]ONI78282.1 ATPase [Kribbella sp. ALI-6-A]
MGVTEAFEAEALQAPLIPGGVLAFDAGNSKTDVALVAADGTVLGTARGGGFEPHLIGAQAAVDGLAPLVAAAARAAGFAVDRAGPGAAVAEGGRRFGATGSSPLTLPAAEGGVPLVEQISACLANADLPIEEERLADAFRSYGWASRVHVANDTFALLRAGIDEPRGVAVVCGAGINCCGLLPDGRTARFPAVGKISGDWGGGQQLAEEAIWAAARADDGRGPATALKTALPQHYGVRSMTELIEAMHLGGIPVVSRLEAVPVLFQVATAGDEVATAIVHRQAEEIVAMATVALRRLDLLDVPTPVILGGGVLTANHPLLLRQITAQLAAAAPHAIPQIVEVPPVVGAILLGLDHTEAGPEAHRAIRTTYRTNPPA